MGNGKSKKIIEQIKDIKEIVALVAIIIAVYGYVNSINEAATDALDKFSALEKNYEVLSQKIDEKVYTLPIGTIISIHGNFKENDTWKLCNGQTIKENQYARELNNLFDSNAKYKDGSIELPNLSNRVLICRNESGEYGEVSGTDVTINTSGLYAQITHKDEKWYINEIGVSKWNANGNISNNKGKKEGKTGINEAVAIGGNATIKENGQIFPPGYKVNFYIRVK